MVLRENFRAMKALLIITLIVCSACASVQSAEPQPIRLSVLSAKEGLNESGGEVCIIKAENSSTSLTAIHALPCSVDVGEGVNKYPGIDRLYKDSDIKYNDAMFITEQHKKQ